MTYCPPLRPPSMHRTARGEWYTVREMTRRVRCGLEDPGFLAPARAVAGEGSAPERARRIREWVARRVLFQPDPPGWELLHHPRAMLEDAASGRASGDCDDVAILTAAMAGAAGLPWRWRMLAFTTDGPWEHVYTEVDVGGGRWADMDTTRPAQYGGVVGPVREVVVQP